MTQDLIQEHKEHQVKVLIQEPKAMAKQRLMDFAASLPTGGGYNYDTEEDEPEGEAVSYTELIERATDFQSNGEYWSEGGRFEGTNVYDGFWTDYALVTELPVDPNNTWGFFSCSC